MHNTREIVKNIHWLGVSDRRLERFENIHPIPDGISYNSYLIMDEKVALLDTVDVTVMEQFFANLEELLAGRKIDYLLVHHVEPDHTAAFRTLVEKHPDLTVVGSQLTHDLLMQFNHLEEEPKFQLIGEGDELDLGQHQLKFFMAPMVHWPEVFFSYEVKNKILFSADAFGTFKALGGNLFNDEVDFEKEYLDEARRYYSNIVGKYGVQVQAVLKKLQDVELKMIAPLHGPIWRSNLDYYLDKYQHWSSYTAEERGVVIAYGSMYGNTEKVALEAANLLAEQGIRNIQVFDVSKTHQSYIIAGIYQYSHILLAAPTYNMNIYLPMHTLLHDMQLLNMQQRKVMIIGNGSWAPVGPKLMAEMINGMKEMEIIGEPLVIKSSITDSQVSELKKLVKKFVEEL